MHRNETSSTAALGHRHTKRFMALVTTQGHTITKSEDKNNGGVYRVVKNNFKNPIYTVIFIF